MKLNSLIPAILLAATGLVQLAVARPSLSQTKPTNVSQSDLNVQLQKALCAQNWGQALQLLDRIKSAAGLEYASQVVMYRGRIEALARQNARVPGLTDGCAVPRQAQTQQTPAPASNTTPVVPDRVYTAPNSIPPAPNGFPPPPPAPNGLPPAPPVPDNIPGNVVPSTIPPTPDTAL